jgi:hypothetical protein
MRKEQCKAWSDNAAIMTYPNLSTEDLLPCCCSEHTKSPTKWLVATRWVWTVAIIWLNWHSGGIFTLRYKPYRLFTRHHSVLCASCMHLTEQLTPRSLEWSPKSLTSDNYVTWNMPGTGPCLIRCLWGIWVRPVGRVKISEGAAKWAQWLCTWQVP